MTGFLYFAHSPGATTTFIRKFRFSSSLTYLLKLINRNGTDTASANRDQFVAVDALSNTVSCDLHTAVAGMVSCMLKYGVPEVISTDGSVTVDSGFTTITGHLTVPIHTVHLVVNASTLSVPHAPQFSCS
jgi:hypothetical protein